MTKMKRFAKHIQSHNSNSNNNTTSAVNSSSLNTSSESNHGGVKECCSVMGEYSYDHTPIPSLHGNLVRNRYRHDPLEFYEQLEILGEGSMGSVSRVRKRVEAIGGSARPGFRKMHSRPTSNPVQFFWRIWHRFNPLSTMVKSSSDSDAESERMSNLTSNYSTANSNRNTGEYDQYQQRNNIRNKCFFFFCPALESSTPGLLVTISEDEDAARGHASDKSDKQGCWGGLLGWRQSTTANNEKQQPHHQQAKRAQTTNTRPVSTHSSFDFDNSSHHSAESNLLTKTDYEQIDSQMNRALQHSTSSIIHYGHKDVIYALKSIHLNRVSNSDFMKELKNEVAILKELDHPHIVKCYETFYYNSSLYLVLEICSGSDLYSRDPYSEEQVCRILRSLLSAVAYMHSKRIVHRDLKYENIMFANSDPDADVKIIDFGLSKKYADNSYLHDTVGTVYTMAPELLRGGYTELADVWSLGVIAFMLLSSSMPFYGKDRKQVIKRIIRGHYEFISRRWKTVSDDAKAILVRMLQHNANKRPSAAEILDDPWFYRHDFDAMGFAPEVAMMDKVQASIQTFAGYGRLKRLALMLIAFKATSEEIGYLRRMFERFDIKHDGELTLRELKEVLQVYEYTDEEMEFMFQAMDLDGTGLVHYSEFLAATIESHGKISEEQVAECFDRLDNDDSGYISRENIVDLLGGNIPQSYIDHIMLEADLNNDNKISYKEFLGLWDERTDAQIKHDQDDVKKRRHLRADSCMSVNSTSTDFSLNSLEGLELNSFEEDEIEVKLHDPATPVAGDKTISAMNAFVLEKGLSNRESLALPKLPTPRRESVTVAKSKE